MKVAEYSWSSLRWTPLRLLRVWIRRRWADWAAALTLTGLGRVRVEGTARDVGRAEIVLDQVRQQGWPA